LRGPISGKHNSIFLTAVRRAGEGNREKRNPKVLPRTQRTRLGSQLATRTNPRISQAYQYRGWRNVLRETVDIVFEIPNYKSQIISKLQITMIETFDISYLRFEIYLKFRLAIWRLLLKLHKKA
jgi:hypothetical protein